VSDPARRHNSIHDAIDALFDEELSDADARDLVDRADARACEEITKTQRLVDGLKRPVDAPDLTEAILDRVEAEREFVGDRWRRVVRVGRLGVAACLLLGLMGVAVAQRFWPEATTIVPEARPMSTFLHTTEREAVDRIRAFDHALVSAEQIACELRSAVDEHRRPPQKLPEPERHVAWVVERADDEPGSLRFTTEVETVEGAGRPCFHTEAVAWRAPDPHAAAQQEGTATAYGAGVVRTWPVRLERVVQMELLRQESEPRTIRVELRDSAFHRLP